MHKAEPYATGHLAESTSRGWVSGEKQEQGGGHDHSDIWQPLRVLSCTSVATSRNKGTRQIHGGSRFSVHRRRPIGRPSAPLGGHQCRSNALLVRRLDSLPLLAGAEPLFQIRNSGFLKSRLHGLRNRQRLLVITGRVVRLAARLGRLSQ